MTDTNTTPRYRKTRLELPPEVALAFADRGLSTSARDSYLAELRFIGWTLQSLSDASGLTRERVRQIVAETDTELPREHSDALPHPLPPTFEAKTPRVYVEPDPSKLARLLELQPTARLSRGTGSKFQADADEYVALLAEVHLVDGVPVYRLAKRLGITHGAVRSRLARYGHVSSATYTSKAYTPLVDAGRRVAPSSGV